jgi:hypothetical protein
MAAVKSKVIVIDRGWGSISKQLRAFKRGKAASVGVQGQEAEAPHTGEEGSELTNVAIGSIHEFGLGVPQRSHWRSTFDEKMDKYKKELDEIAVRVYTPGQGSVEGDLLLLGEQYKKDVIDKMRAGIAPEKGDGDPKHLIDTGQYMNSFSVQIVNPEDKREVQ